MLLLVFTRRLGTAQGPSLSIRHADAPVTFRSEINFVEVPAIVTDESGAFVRGLTADDFEIYEDGRLQNRDLPADRLSDRAPTFSGPQRRPHRAGRA